jgi:hypothetical protein
MKRRPKWSHVSIALGVIAALAFAVPALGVTQSVKKAIRKEVARQIGKAIGPAGQRGLQGLQGPQGDPAQYPQTLPSGRTEIGVFATRFRAAAGSSPGDASISFPIPLAAAPTPSFGGSAGCTGTAANPTAPPGQLCVYFGQSVNLESVENDLVNSAGAFGSADRQGAILDVVSGNSGDTIARGSWAVTAP